MRMTRSGYVGFFSDQKSTRPPSALGMGPIYIYIYIERERERERERYTHMRLVLLSKFTSARFLSTDWAEGSRLQQFWTVVGCSVCVGSGPPLSLVDLRVEGLRVANISEDTAVTKVEGLRTLNQ